MKFTRDKLLQAASVKAQLDAKFETGKFRGVPYKHQNVAAAFMDIMERCIVADSVGLGKTIEALMYASKVIKEEPFATVVIFTPGRGLVQWQEEVFRFLGFKPSIVSGDKVRRSYIVSRQPTMLLINYEIFVRHPHILDGLENVSLVILDEAAIFRTHTTKTAIAVKAFTKKAKRIVAMTATPIETSLADIHSIAEALYIDGFPTWAEFKRSFVKVKRFQGYKYGRAYNFESIVGYQNLPVALELLSPFIIRRTADDIGGSLPAIVASTQEFDFDPEHMAYYKQLRRAVLDQYSGAPALHQLQRAVDIADIGAKRYSPKMDYIVELLTGDLLNKKAIIYATHLDTLGQITQVLRANNITYEVMDGTVSLENRAQIQSRYNALPDPQVLVADDVIKSSLNLPVCKHLFILDLPHNPAKLKQIVGRARRITSTSETIFVHILLMSGSHEQEIFDVSNFRSALSQFILDDSNESLIPKYSEEQLLSILRNK